MLSLEDVARGGYEVIKHLGVQRLKATVGPSMGGMTALAFEILFPGVSDGLLSMSSGPRSLPFAIALRSLQREIIRKDPGWQGGNYPRDAVPLTGMRLARKLGMITYRSAEEWRMRFGRERTTSPDTSGDQFGMVFEVEAYLEHHANKFIGPVRPELLSLSFARERSVRRRGARRRPCRRGSARSRVKRALIIGVTTDFLFPIHQQRELAEGLEAPGREIEFVELNSLQGHDSFLVDMDSYRPLIARSSSNGARCADSRLMWTYSAHARPRAHERRRCKQDATYADRLCRFGELRRGRSSEASCKHRRARCRRFGPGGRARLVCAVHLGRSARTGPGGWWFPTPSSSFTHDSTSSSRTPSNSRGRDEWRQSEEEACFIQAPDWHVKSCRRPRKHRAPQEVPIYARDNVDSRWPLEALKHRH